MNVLRNAAGVVLLVILILIAISLSGLAAMAQTPRCGGYADVLADLATSYHERIVWVGDRGAECQMVITAVPDGSTWTALLVRGDVACLVSAGKNRAASKPGEDI